MLGHATNQADVFNDSESFCEATLRDDSIYTFLRRQRGRLFPDEAFEDLYDERGRRGVPPSIVAVVMVLQRLFGLSDREAVERYTFDSRWRYACGVSGYGEWPSFAHTVLVDMRERLRLSERPDRILEAALGPAKEAGLLGRRQRVLDSTPLYDAVATMDTITFIRSAIMGLLLAADPVLEAELREAIRSGDDYASLDKPRINWDDKAARNALIDSRAKDGYACLMVLEGRTVGAGVGKHAQMLADGLAQDLEEGANGVLRIKRGVARERLLSTVDPDSRHGHKTEARGFDGYKGHVAVDPESELISAATVTAGNVADSAVAEELIADLVAEDQAARSSEQDDAAVEDGGDDRDDEDKPPEDGGAQADGRTVYGDTHYGTGEFQAYLEDAEIESRCKAQSLVSTDGLYSKTQFRIDLERQMVTCPNGITVAIRPAAGGGGMASFGRHCRQCPLAQSCTRSAGGRNVTIHRHEAVLSRARTRQATPEWGADYRATRPKVERKIAHLTRCMHGGRRARVRGLEKVRADFKLRAAAVNYARLARLGLRWTRDGWKAEGGTGPHASKPTVMSTPRLPCGQTSSAPKRTMGRYRPATSAVAAAIRRAERLLSLRHDDFTPAT